MGVITLSLDKKSEKILRDTAKIIYGIERGALSKTVNLALKELAKNNYNKNKYTYLLDNPMKIGKGFKMPKRDELHDKKILY